MDLSLQDLEAAINWWRQQRPASGDESTLSAEVSILASLYAVMIWCREASVAAEEIDPEVLPLLETWRQHAPQH
jgi:hypothetical protein